MNPRRWPYIALVFAAWWLLRAESYADLAADQPKPEHSLE
jgi:hypothetical protein